MLVPTSRGTNTALYPTWASRGSLPPPGWASSVGVLDFFITYLCILLQLPHLSLFLPSSKIFDLEWVEMKEYWCLTSPLSPSLPPAPFLSSSFSSPLQQSEVFPFLACLVRTALPFKVALILPSPFSLVTVVYGSRNTRSIMENFLKIDFLSPGILVSVTSS